MNIVNWIFTLVIILNTNTFCQEAEFEGKQIPFLSIDGLEITADLYRVSNHDAPYIILFHQANYSRGSYRTIAPKLNELGYNCLAIDQRSGNKARNVINKTHERAVLAGKQVKYENAIQDVEAAIFYVKDTLKAKKIIIWGSSYSASIVIYMGSKYPASVDGVLSFSPGEYFKIDERKIESYAKAITCPVFFTSAKSEKGKWIGIYDNILSTKKYYLPEQGGFHGSKALWPEKKGNELLWEAVISFLKSITS
jgi:dienelactone hydrolase